MCTVRSIVKVDWVPIFHHLLHSLLQGMFLQEGNQILKNFISIPQAYMASNMRKHVHSEVKVDWVPVLLYHLHSLLQGMFLEDGNRTFKTLFQIHYLRQAIWENKCISAHAFVHANFCMCISASSFELKKYFTKDGLKVFPMENLDSNKNVLKILVLFLLLFSINDICFQFFTKLCIQYQ